MIRAMLAALWLVIIGGIGSADEVDATRIQHFQLTNGLQIIVVPRHDLPLVAVNLTVGLGAVDDPPGQWGMAHLLEHVALGGSTTIGSLDPTAEAAALDELDRAHGALREAQQARAPDPVIIARLRAGVEQAQRAALALAEQGEILGGRLEARGAIGTNAATTADATQYFTWLPPDQIEYWLSLEAARLSDPVFRRFYSEREVVLQEVVAMTGGNQTLAERFVSDLFPGGEHALAGNLRDIASIDRQAALAAFHRQYRPDNIVVVAVGPVNADGIRDACQRLFGALRTEVSRPMQEGPRFHLSRPAARIFTTARGPSALIAFPLPHISSRDQPAVEAIAAILASADISPIHRAFEGELRGLWRVQVTPAYPSQKQAWLFLLQVHGRAGMAEQDLLGTVKRALDPASVSDDDMRVGLLAAEMSLAAQLSDVPTLAAQIGVQQVGLEGLHLPFSKLERLRELTPEDLRAVMRRLFVWPDPSPEKESR
jgi:predicted Zn-dependent peptidase